MLRWFVIVAKFLAMIVLTTSPVGCAMASLTREGTATHLLLATVLVTPFAAAGLAIGLPLLLLLKALGRFSTSNLFIVATCAGMIVGTTLGFVNLDSTPAAHPSDPRDFNKNGAALGVILGAGFGAWAGFLWIAFFGKPGQLRHGAFALPSEAADTPEASEIPRTRD